MIADLARWLTDHPRLTFRVSIGCYLVSLAVPAFYTSSFNPAYGWMCLLLGWISLYDWNVSWLANPAYFYALLCYGKGRFEKSGKWSKYALLLAITFLLINNVSVGGVSGHGQVTRYGPGFFLWISSHLILMGLGYGRAEIPSSADEAIDQTDRRRSGGKAQSSWVGEI